VMLLLLTLSQHIRRGAPVVYKKECF
jgi:hypothetical protein